MSETRMWNQFQFRAKRLVDKKWVYGELSRDTDSYYINYTEDDTEIMDAVDEATICQKIDGTELWEKDIFKLQGRYLVLLWNTKSLAFMLYDPVDRSHAQGTTSLKAADVVGNIYDNPQYFTAEDLMEIDAGFDYRITAYWKYY